MAVLTVLYSAIRFIYNKHYQFGCEDFYGIPGKYFYSDVNNRLLYLACIIILAVMCFVPTVINKYYEKYGCNRIWDKIYVVFLAITIGMEMGFFNVYNLIEIMRQTYKAGDIFININSFLNRHANITIAVVVILGSFFCQNVPHI